MILSVSTLNAFLDCPRSYLNKQMMLPKVEFDYFKYGKEGHTVVQKHISAKESDPRLVGKLQIPFFPIVEEKDFDERLKFKIPFGKHEFIGFLDARNDELKVFADIKISTSLWTLKQFVNLTQRKVYQLAFIDYSFIGISLTPDLTQSSIHPIPCRPKDAEWAKQWIEDGIKAIETSDFEPRAEANCFRCVYKNSCERSKCGDSL